MPRFILGLLVVFEIGIIGIIGIIPPLAEAGPQSTTYELKEYTFGAGGTSQAGADSSTYTLFGTAGELEYDKLTSSTYALGGGLIFTLKANVPPAPSFTNPSQNYDRLKFIIDNGGNPSDATFAIAISTDNFAADTRYIQNDNTIGATLGSEDWQTYANWGGASGEYVTGLAAGTTYYIKVKAEQGNFTESEYGSVANAATSLPSLTFGIDSATLNFTSLNPGNSYTDSSKSTILTTSTNAYNGYIVYGRVTQALTFSTFNIANYASPNSAPSTWSGTGFGYTTDDASLTGGAGNRFTNGGPKYAGFTTSAPGDPVADHAGPVLTAISSENFTISYRVTADQETEAGVYTTTVLYVVVPEY